MLVSFNWLKEFVEIDKSAEEIADLLTMGGLEVETVTHVGEGLDRILTARIEEITDHPGAANLKLARINLGDREETVVCGAPNIRMGQIVPFVPAGAVLPSGLEITEREIKGVSSRGMICSEKELDLGEDASGILVFDETTEPGRPLAEACPFVEDAIFEIGVTPNRGDCLSILGTAREVAAFTDKPLKIPESAPDEEAEPIESKAAVEVLDADLCPRYVVRMVEGVKIAPSPFEIRLKLFRSGVRPISNVVDVTNLVLLECGQPLHAFDFDLLEEGKIVVRRCDPGETFVTLDEERRKLPENALMIRDGKRSVALAGIMGGLNSEIVDSTENVLIESASFERFGTRRTAKALGMSTEASFRFERGVDPEGAMWAAHRSAYLMAKIAGGKTLAGTIDVYPEPITRDKISVTDTRINEVLGTNVSKQDMVSYLSRLGIEVDENEHGTLVCSPPSWRWDLEKAEDIMEEVARLYGFQNIPISMPVYRSAPDNTRDVYHRIRRVAGLMTASGYSEMVTMSFVSKTASEEFVWGEKVEPLSLLNPLTEDYTVMRTSLIPGLLSMMKRNMSFRSTNLKLFEIGKVFKPVPGRDLPEEDLKVAGLATGARFPELWNLPQDEQTDFYDLKGALESIFEGMGAHDVEFSTAEVPFLHPGKSAEMSLDGKGIGYLGELSPERMRAHDLETPVQVFEILLEPLLLQSCKQRVFKPIPRYPYIERDVSIIVLEKVSGAEIKRLISRLPHDIINSVTIFDLYRGKSIPEGYQSIAFRIRYQSEDRTLTDEDVQMVHSQVIETLVKETGATMRD
jgi:phenylalanyl-tRNA synthetase beta chain